MSLASSSLFSRSRLWKLISGLFLLKKINWLGTFWQLIYFSTATAVSTKSLNYFFFFLGGFPFYIAAAEQRIYFYNTTKGSALLPYNSGPKIALLGSWSAHSVLKGTLIGNKSQIPKDTLASIPSFPSKWTLLFSRLQSFFFTRRTFFSITF